MYNSILLNHTKKHMTGTIKKLTDKNFGFITSDEGGNDLFFHANNLQEVDFDALQEGDKVEFIKVSFNKAKLI